MRTLDNPILFHAEVRHRLRGLFHRGVLMGRLAPDTAPSCRCPEEADTRIPAPDLPDALHRAVVAWGGEGSLPPLSVVVLSHRSHPPGREAALFTEALAAVLREAVDAALPPPAAWSRVRLLPIVGALPPEIQALADAGHLLQAAELLRGMLADASPAAQRQALSRFLDEVFFGESPNLLAAAVWDLAPRGADGLIRAAVGVELEALAEAASAVKQPQRVIVLAELREALRALAAPALDLRASQQVVRAAYSAGYLLSTQGALHQRVTARLHRALITSWLGGRRG